MTGGTYRGRAAVGRIDTYPLRPLARHELETDMHLKTMSSSPAWLIRSTERCCKPPPMPGSPPPSASPTGSPPWATTSSPVRRRAAAGKKTEETGVPLDAAVVLGLSNVALHVWSADPMLDQVHDHLGHVPLERITTMDSTPGRTWQTCRSPSRGATRSSSRHGAPSTNWWPPSATGRRDLTGARQGPAGVTGRPSAAQAWKPPTMSVAPCRPRARRDAAARVEA